MTEAPWKKNKGTDETVVEVVEEAPVGIEAAVTSSDVAVIQEEETSIASATRSYSQTPDFSPDELLIPKLRLAQGQTAEVLSGEAKPGQWVLMGNEPTDECEVVVLQAGRAREFRIKHPGYDDDNKVRCRSNDAVQGIGDPGIKCDGCPFAEWSDGDGGKRRPPECAMIYSYQVFSLTHQSLALLEFKRTGMESAKLINTMIVQRKMGNFVIKLSGDKQEKGRAVFYTPKVTPRPISQEQRELAEMFKI